MGDSDIQWFQDYLAWLLSNNGIKARRLPSGVYTRFNYVNRETGAEWPYRRGYGGVKLSKQEVSMIHLIGMTGSQKRVHPTWVRYIVGGIRPNATFWVNGKAEKSGPFGLGSMTNFQWSSKGNSENFRISDRLVDQLNSDRILREALLSAGHRQLQLGQTTDQHGATYGYIWVYKTQAQEIARFVSTANLIARNVKRVAGE